MGLPAGNLVTSYSNVALAGSGKRGILKKLDNGYYEIILGAFGAFGNGGWLYDERSALRYLEQNVEFIQLLQQGRIRSEWGHPVRQPGMSDADWFVRINTILESNWSSHIRRVRTSTDTVKDERGRAVVACIGEVTPCGVHGAAFQRMLDNPDEDVNYSIRCFADRDFRQMRKHLTRIVNWDTVGDPGVKVASKYMTPSLESKEVARMLDEAEFQLLGLRDQLQVPMNDESFESHNSMIKIIESLSAHVDHKHFPQTLSW